jgi:ADP-ribose pyrophosphatase
MSQDNKHPKWKVLKSNYLFKAPPWLTIREDAMELPNGNQIPHYYVLEYPDWVNAIAITSEGKFVFIYQYRHGLEQYYYELAAGVRDAGETPLAAAQRELLEETGYGGGTWKEYMVTCANPSTHSNFTYCFIATGVEKLGDQKLDATEDISVHLLSAQEVKALLDSNQIMQSLMAAPLWKYVAENRELL